MSAPYMPLYVGDYLGDTSHLSALEQGVYLLLLMAMWRAGGSLPDDPSKLAKYGRVRADQWGRIAPTIMAFFTASDGSITSKRLTKELVHVHERSRSMSVVSQRGVEAKRLKRNGQAKPNGKPNDNSNGRITRTIEDSMAPTGPNTIFSPATPSPAEGQATPAQDTPFTPQEIAYFEEQGIAYD